MRKIVFLALGFLLILVIGGGVLLSQTNSKTIKRMDGTGVPKVSAVVSVAESAVPACLALHLESVQVPSSLASSCLRRRAIRAFRMITS
jgi:hypothetical protein